MIATYDLIISIWQRFFSHDKEFIHNMPVLISAYKSSTESAMNG